MFEIYVLKNRTYIYCFYQKSKVHNINNKSNINIINIINKDMNRLQETTHEGQSKLSNGQLFPKIYTPKKG